MHTPKLLLLLIGFVIAHPFCTDSSYPTQKTLPYCDLWNDSWEGSCCDSDDQILKFDISDPVCERYLRNISCQVCSPISAHVMRSEMGQKQTWPVLCKKYCERFWTACNGFNISSSLIPGGNLNYGMLEYCSLFSEDMPGNCYTDNTNDLYSGDILPGLGPYHLANGFPNINFNDRKLKGKYKDIHMVDMVFTSNAEYVIVSYQHGIVIIFENSYQTSTYRVLLDLRESVTFQEPSELGFYGVAITHDKLYCKYSSGYQRDVIEVYEHQNYYITSKRRVILEYDLNSPTHHGSKPIIGPDGMLWVATGDGTSVNDGPENNPALDLTKMNGKILRINTTDLSEPSDNPFGFVWAYGFRNPFRIHFDTNGNLLVASVGNSKHESIYIAQKGKFHGWNRREGNDCFHPSENCETQDEVFPIYTYPHKCDNKPCISGQCVIGGLMYEGDMYPELQGVYLFSDFSLTPNIYGLRYNKENIYQVSMDRYSIETDPPYSCDSFFVGGFAKNPVTGRLYTFMQGSPGTIYLWKRKGEVLFGSSGSSLKPF